ncbi:hypothetical protein PoB_007369200 [Plakobranchus ocellatus]|uniref:Uncharacterized protein n=1 Tax=Plakobranchus ocellatus TaxID=259542 RepID=A0AAV4DS98_9GAST|nr:hypothetical protein PoB_007369200 [Plakobranchus ocellatus]
MIDKDVWCNDGEVTTPDPSNRPHKKERKTKKRKSQEHGPLANNALTTISPQTTPQHTSTQLCFRHRASVSFPQQMLPSSTRWPRNTPENKTEKYFSSKKSNTTRSPTPTKTNRRQTVPLQQVNYFLILSRSLRVPLQISSIYMCPLQNVRIEQGLQHHRAQQTTA